MVFCAYCEDIIDSCSICNREFTLGEFIFCITGNNHAHRNCIVFNESHVVYKKWK